MSAIALGAVALTLAVTPALASAETVEEGESIQAAIDDAQPGDTITIGRGEFRENLTIRTDDLTIRGAGNGRHGTTLMPATAPTPAPVDPSGRR